MAFVQAVHAIRDATGTALSAPAFTNVTAGQLVSGQFTQQDDNTRTLTVSDGTANVYTVVDKANAGGFTAWSFYSITTVGGALVVTGTLSATNPFARIQVRQDSGGWASLNKHAIATSATFGTGTDAVTSGAQTTTVAGCLIVGFAYDDTAATLPTAGTNFTGRDGFTNAAGDALICEERTQAAAGSVAATFTTTAGTDQIFASMLAFAPPAATTTLMGQACL